MISEEAARISSHCRHYAMCKIDFLGTGLCPSGPKRHYVSYYPQGRMDICSALAQDLIPLTPALVEIADTCTLCGICDKQCYFYTGMRPMVAMQALKVHVAGWLQEGRAIETVREDSFLKKLRNIVGEDWATNDPAVLVTYANDPFPLKEIQMPAYVVLPSSSEETAEIVKLANEFSLTYAVRGNGASVFGLVFSDGVIIDMNRMKGIVIDKQQWVAMAEPGATAFEVQAEAYKNGFRINTAEPAATLCGNIVCTGLFSTWSAAYGVAADNLIDAEFIDDRGQVFSLAHEKTHNLYAFKNLVLPPPPAICTKGYVRMYPTTSDEEGLLVPFPGLEEAISFARELGQRRIGLALAVLGEHYLSTFMTPSAQLENRIKKNLAADLGIGAMVFMVGDRYARAAVKSMAPITIDNGLFRMLALGLPNLGKNQWTDLLRDLESDRYPYEVLFRDEMLPLMETILDPSPQTLASALDEDLRDFYTELYTRPEMTDLVWLNMFRIVSSRMARHKHIFAFVIFAPLNRIELFSELNTIFKETGDRHGIDNAYGFLTPIDFGKRAVFEYDYYLDQTNRSEAEEMGLALAELDPILERMGANTGHFTTMPYILNQGCARKEHFLYSRF
jgi:hypothetical protein